MRLAASVTSSGCSGALPFPITGVIGSRVRSTMFSWSPPRWPTTPCSLQYSSPRVNTLTGNFSRREREWSAMAFHRLYGTCPARSALTACVLDWIQCPKLSDSHARAAARGAR